jgi:SAM-dependent methyltransferase
MIRETIVDPKGGRKIRFNEHKLAHELLDGLQGLECGASSHNSFNLPGSRNVAPLDDFDFYARDNGPSSQVGMCGAYVEIDIPAEAHDIPVEDNSQDYVISSHVFEHFPNPIQVLIEWRRIVRDGGYVFMIVPLRDALDSDKARPISTIEQINAAYDADVTVDTWNEVFPDESHVARRGHYFVYTPELIKQMVEAVDGDYWELVAEEPMDTKVGNGFTLVYKISKTAVDPVYASEDPNVHVYKDAATGGWVVSAPAEPAGVAGEPELFVPDVEASKADTEKVKTVRKSRKKSGDNN